MVEQQSSVVNEAPFVFTPPLKVLVDDGKGDIVAVDRDPSRHFVRMEGQGSGSWYSPMPFDPVLCFCQVFDDGSVHYKHEPIPVADRSLLSNLPALRTACKVWEAAQANAKAKARPEYELNAESSTGKRARDDAPTVRIKPPREWNGECANGDIASDLAVWLWEVKDYLQLTNTPPDRQAGVATSLLGGSARTQYLVKRTHATNADPLNFKHTMQFFESTLKELFVPVAQRAHLYWRYLRDKEWLLPHDAKWSITEQLLLYQGFLNVMEAQGIVPDTTTKAQVLLTSLPLVVYDALKLPKYDLYQSDYIKLKKQIELEEHVLQRRYDDYTAANRANHVVSEVIQLKRHKPDTVGHGGGNSGVGSGSAQSHDSRNQPTCFICHSTTHAIINCPFVNTNINKRRVGFDPKVQELVRNNVAKFLSDGLPNAEFIAAGGRTNVTTES